MRRTRGPAPTRRSPLSRAASTTDATGSVSSTPQMNPRPRTSCTLPPTRSAMPRRSAPSTSPFRRTPSRKSGRAMWSTTARATVATMGPPPKVVPWSPG
jgi:hypothetical protein